MQKLRQTFEQVSAIATDSELLLPHVELHADRCAVIDGCKGILSYDEACVRLNCGDRLVLLRGCDLCLEQLAGDYVRVSGMIVALEFSSL